MTHLTLPALLAAALTLAGCSGGSETRGGLDDVSGGFVRGGDTYGTNRRVDVYGASTAPSLPTIGAVGYGK